MIPRFRSIWLSDVHLGTRSCKAEALLEFLETHECEFLYLVGDIVDFWKLGRSLYWPPSHSEVVRRLLAMARDRTVVTFVPGNHDEYLRRFCDMQVGNILVVREAVHRTADGRLLLVVHGDEFDAVTRCHRWLTVVEDVGYELLMLVSRWFNHGQRLLGREHWSLAGYVTSSLRRAALYVASYERAVADAAMRRGMDGVVCGHIHKAELRPMGSLLYCNAGDWVESCTALAEREDGTLTLLTADRRARGGARRSAEHREQFEGAAQLLGA